MDALSKDIQDAIQKNLPAQVAGTLGDFIKQAEADRIALTAIRISEKAQAERLTDTQVQRDKANLELASLRKREGDIADAEKRLLIASKDVERATAVQQAVQGVVSMVFGNTLVKKTIFESGMVPVTQPGGYPTQQSSSSTRNETVEG